jgi:hypothetical protein
MKLDLEIEFDEAFKDGGLGWMLGNLIRENIFSDPERKRLFDHLGIDIGIEVKDIETSLTLKFRFGKLKITEGIEDKVKTKIVVNSTESLLNLTKISFLKIGPFAVISPFNLKLIDLIRDIMKGNIKIEGAFRNLYPLWKLSRLISVE